MVHSSEKGTQWTSDLKDLQPPNGQMMLPEMAKRSFKSQFSKGGTGKAEANASIVGPERVVFNIKGNDYRLVVAINHRHQIVFIKWIGTHGDYGKVRAEIGWICRWRRLRSRSRSSGELSRIANPLRLASHVNNLSAS
jgi:mRNA-degrading endonuclease HigB of HigAB toxin-antitoxin module